MIGSITGTPTIVTDKYALIDVAGIGYKVFLTTGTLSDITKDHDNITLFTHLIVREDALDLYGFTTMQERDFFELLISVSGVGPKGALGILSVSSIDNLKKAIASSEVSYLTSVSGIGKKTAEKVVIELRDKLAIFKTDENGFTLRGDSDVIEALKTLGYTQNEARDALQQIPNTITDTNTKIKEALKLLGK
jgi:Holliday junction DNA helicase RuvA